MPVIAKTASRGADILDKAKLQSLNAYQLFKASCVPEFSKNLRIVQSSFGLDPNENAAEVIDGAPNGFVHAVIRAYNNHLHLCIRPEDVWFAILVQIGSHINAHAEELQDKFVAHRGQKELKVVLHEVKLNAGEFATLMGEKIRNNLIDPEIHDWAMPDFTTTTKEDIAVASVVFMGALKTNFRYRFVGECGIPTVKLLGEREDWVKLRTRLNLLPHLGTEPTQWYHLLTPILDSFLQTYDMPTSPQVFDFWQRAANMNSAEGPDYAIHDYCTGWINAFCFWSGDGKRLYRDNEGYGSIDYDDIPYGWAAVPVKCEVKSVEYETVMVAGTVGNRIYSSCEVMLDGIIGLDTVQPSSGWWLYQPQNTVSSLEMDCSTSSQLKANEGDDEIDYELTLKYFPMRKNITSHA